MDPKLFEAASTGHLSFFEELTHPNSSTLLQDQVTIEKNTVLHVALQFKQFDAAKIIVNLTPSLMYEKNSKDNTPLHVAARVGDSSMVKLLIDQAKKLDVEKGGRQQLLSFVNQDGDTALHVAVRCGNSEVVKELINENDPAKLAMQVNNAGESALFLAVDRQQYDIASNILRDAPDCSYDGRHGMNVLHALVLQTSCYINKGDLLLKEMEENTERNEFDFEASFRRRVFAVFWIINMLFLIPIPKFFFADDGSKEEDSVPIPWAKFATIPEDFVKKVMEKCPSTIEQRDDSGWTPLHVAAHMGNKEFVKLLLENGNSPAYVRNNEGLSALHIAAKENNDGVMDILVTACPDIYELLDNKGRNALHAAVESESWKALNCFGRSEFEGLVNEQDEEGNTPSNLAAINGRFYRALDMSRGRCVDLNATNKQGFTTMDDVLLTSESLLYSAERELWEMGARPSLRGTLLKMGIQKLDPRKKPKLAGDGKGNGNDDGNGDGSGKGKGNDNDEGRSVSNFIKQVREVNMLVATLIATVTFTAAFTVPGGFNQNGNVGEGLAVLRKKTAFRVFLIANTLAFGLSTTSVFIHFLASATIDEKVAFHKKLARRVALFTNWSIGALLVAFIAGTYTVVPHSLGITVAVLLCCCFLSSMFIPLTTRKI